MSNFGHASDGTAMSQHLYHFSEDPSIKIFEPRPGRRIEGHPPDERLVWAIDEWHSPVYFFPRECPRVMLWPVEGSLLTDVEQWIGSNTRMAAHIETAWTERFDQCELFRYTFSRDGFESLSDHGVHVSKHSVRPLDITPVGDLRKALSNADVDLRVLPSLQPLAEAWHSSLWFSGVRLRNATEWVAPA